MGKCQFCNYDDIIKILYNDVVLDKCNKCNYLKLSFDDYELILRKYIYNYNIGNYKKELNYNQLNENNIYKINLFLDFLDVSSFNIISNCKDINCNFCNENVVLAENKFYKKFKIYFCKYCESMYILKKDFEDASLYFKNRVDLYSKWYGFIFKIFDKIQLMF